MEDSVARGRYQPAAGIGQSKEGPSTLQSSRGFFPEREVMNLGEKIWSPDTEPVISILSSAYFYFSKLWEI